MVPKCASGPVDTPSLGTEETLNLHVPSLTYRLRNSRMWDVSTSPRWVWCTKLDPYCCNILESDYLDSNFSSPCGSCYTSYAPFCTLLVCILTPETVVITILMIVDPTLTYIICTLFCYHHRDMCRNRFHILMQSKCGWANHLWGNLWPMRWGHNKHPLLWSLAASPQFLRKSREKQMPLLAYKSSLLTAFPAFLHHSSQSFISVPWGHIAK